jgi:hypothetical protein
MVGRIRAALSSGKTAAVSGSNPDRPSATLQLALDSSQLDAAGLQDQIGLANGLKCSQCQGPVILEMMADFPRGQGHWFSAHLLCRTCRHPF